MRKSLRKTISVLLFISLISCQRESKLTLIKEQAFKKFVSRQRLVELPIHFDLTNISDSLTQPAIVEPHDSLFIPVDFAKNRIWGIYKDTSKYFLFINLGEAAVYIPEIIIFDKHGNKIQEEQLLVDGCGADCGYYCNAIANIYKENSNSDIKFFARDSVRYYECDSVGNETLGTLVHYIKFKSGFIDKSGSVTVKIDSINFVK